MKAYSNKKMDLINNLRRIHYIQQNLCKKKIFYMQCYWYIEIKSNLEEWYSTKKLLDGIKFWKFSINIYWKLNEFILKKFKKFKTFIKLIYKHHIGNLVFFFFKYRATSLIFTVVEDAHLELMPKCLANTHTWNISFSK